MTLYCKAGPDGKELGDCPFAHLVRMVLAEKGIDYELKPSVQETKPEWLVEHFEGKMPALRNGKECKVESEVIAEYLDQVIPEPSLKAEPEAQEKAAAAIEGIFPAIAKYIKHTPDGDEEDMKLLAGLEAVLGKLEAHLQATQGDFLTGPKITLMDCSLTPKLYILKTLNEAFKKGALDLAKFPAVSAYMAMMFARPSFVKTVYPVEVMKWGWAPKRG